MRPSGTEPLGTGPDTSEGSLGTDPDTSEVVRAVENCNRLVRRWYPKGTDFSRLTRRQIRDLEDTINSIHREAPDGETAYACDQRLAKAA